LYCYHIDHYKKLFYFQGIDFYTEVGALMVGTRGNEYITNVVNVVHKQNIPCSELDGRQLGEKFPYFNTNTDDLAVYEPQNAGHISPRKLVQAQKTIAQKQGCTVINDIVKDVKRVVTVSSTNGSRRRAATAPLRSNPGSATEYCRCS